MLATSEHYETPTAGDLETTPKAASRMEKERTLVERDINVEAKRRAGKA